MNIICFTNSFPYDDQYTEISFLQNEIHILAQEFKIYIVPARDRGEKLILDDDIKVINTLAEALRKDRRKSLIIKFIKSFKYTIFFKELTKCKKLSDITNLVANTNYINSVFKWACNNRNLFEQNRLIVYTYWSTAITSGLIYFRKKTKLVFKIVSRAHGDDLYIERTGFIPYYYHRLKNLEKLFPASKAGRDYLVEKYPEYKEKYYTSYLGTKNTEALVRRIPNNPKLIVSCSVIRKLKRVDRIYASILVLVKRNQDISFEWVHLGGGTLMDELNQQVDANNTPNLSVKITGILSNNEIHTFYKNNFVSCFVHASESEGLPVSFMEAQSYGIPIISTNVGGVEEIVNKNNGILIDPKADIIEMAEAIEKIVLDEDLRSVLSKNALKNWEINFNAEKNYSEFAYMLKNL